ncbi:solute carrier family 15 member 2 [Trichonephila inaurata madagascariensis]|uniref:Oligopeptide transporter 1 n=1 Tax=Trichonephila inaurata madagascariensis TaxID=2747483 RepID=A0A8X6Y8F4_9ARAC|nr:solute carrier family 15 member 2 [Trichonephila inaurata madagascariensis]
MQRLCIQSQRSISEPESIRRSRHLKRYYSLHINAMCMENFERGKHQVITNNSPLRVLDSYKNTSEKEEQETESRDETDDVDEEPTKTDDEEKNKDTSKKQKEKKKKEKEKSKKEKEKSKKGKEKSKKGEDKSKKGQDKNKIPKGAFFIFAYEFCERFNFYGLSAIQTMYLFRELDFDESTSVKIYHGIEVIAYLMPIFSAILADTWLGKFRAIVYLSIVYSFGNIILAIGSIPNQLIIMRAISLIGLFTLSVGTGGIKPCVSSFGGDQFSDEQEEMRHQFFSAFYFAINSGSLISTALTPVLRQDVTCFGGTSCFPLAYLVTTSIYIIGFILFIIGKTFYVRKPAEGSVLVSFCSCIGHAVYRRATVKDEKRENCLDYADDKYEKSLITDIKSVLRILYMYIPLPLFWALWEQQGSRWVLQGSKMDGEVQGHFIQPDQMILLNPFLILIIIPILNWVIYPLLGKLNFFNTPLQRMTLGGILVACSYLIAAFISLRIESDAHAIPPEGESEMVIVNNSPCTLKMDRPDKLTLEEFSTASLNVPLKEVSKWRFVPSGCNTTITVEKDFKLSKTFHLLMVALDGEDLVIQVTNDSRKKLKSGNPRIRLLFSIDYKFTEDEKAFFLVQGKSSNIHIFPKKMTKSRKVGMTEYYSMKPGEYELFLTLSEKDHEEEPIEKMKLKQGGSTVIFFYRKESKRISVVRRMETVKANSLHILWQIPQYVVLTTGEAMFSITGLDFSYSQAPQSLKAVIQAIWQSTTAIGNLLVVVLTEVKFKKQSHELVMYSVLMILSMGVFGVLAYFYKYVENEKEKESKS